MVHCTRRNNRHDAVGNVRADADEFLSGIPRRQSKILFNGVRGVGRSRFDERSDRIFFAGLDNFNFLGVAGRLATLARTFPIEKSIDVRGDNFDLVFADDVDSWRGVP